jgi:hypothetical protein
MATAFVPPLPAAMMDATDTPAVQNSTTQAAVRLTFDAR